MGERRSPKPLGAGSNPALPVKFKSTQVKFNWMNVWLPTRRRWVRVPQPALAKNKIFSRCIALTVERPVEARKVIGSNPIASTGPFSMGLGGTQFRIYTTQHWAGVTGLSTVN